MDGYKVFHIGVACVIALCLLGSAILTGASWGSIKCQSRGSNCQRIGPYHVNEWSMRNPDLGEVPRNAQTRIFILAVEIIFAVLALGLVGWRGAQRETRFMMRIIQAILCALSFLMCFVVMGMEAWFASGYAIYYPMHSDGWSIYATSWACAAVYLSVAGLLFLVDAIVLTIEAVNQRMTEHVKTYLNSHSTSPDYKATEVRITKMR